MFSLTGKDQKAKIKKGGDHDLRNVLLGGKRKLEDLLLLGERGETEFRCK